jgi:hypothetical protein
MAKVSEIALLSAAPLPPALAAPPVMALTALAGWALYQRFSERGPVDLLSTPRRLRRLRADSNRPCFCNISWPSASDLAK